MLTEQDYSYHRTRAQGEMDMAYRAENRRVAEAHMKLAALHMERLKRQDDYCDGSAR